MINITRLIYVLAILLWHLKFRYTVDPYFPHIIIGPPRFTAYMYGAYDINFHSTLTKFQKSSFQTGTSYRHTQGPELLYKCM